MNRRLQWLQDRGVINQTQPPTVDDISLKTATIKQLFKDASVAELLDLQQYVKWQLFERGQDVKVVLSTYCGSFENRCIYHQVYATVIRPIISDRIKISFPNITEAQHDNIAEFVAKAMSPKSIRSHKTIEVDALNFLEECGVSIEELSGIYDDVTTIMNELNNPQVRGSDVHRKYGKYTSMDLTNSYLINAVEQLRDKGFSIPYLILTTIRIPYGRRIEACFSDRYGDYVKFVDDELGVPDSFGEESDDD